MGMVLGKAKIKIRISVIGKILNLKDME